jgi:hypothetical protein
MNETNERQTMPLTFLNDKINSLKQHTPSVSKYKQKLVKET